MWDGHQLRDFTYVDDAVEAFLLAAAADSSNGRIFNLGGHGPVSLKQVADLLVELGAPAGYVERSFPPERKQIDIGDYYANDDAIRKALGWRPRTDLREGLARTMAYFREHFGEYV